MTNSGGWFDYPRAMANCALMGIGPSELKHMSLYEYEAVLALHTDAHDPQGPQVEAAEPQTVAAAFALLTADQRYTH